jgi:signal transduction histidine kinase
MPTGGTLTIETANIRRQAGGARPPVSYALLRITDTGRVPSAAKDGLFEPLYSEQWDNPGDSLELSAVYGIVKRAGGWISIHSQHGVGSSIEIFLPCAAGSKAA